MLYKKLFNGGTVEEVLDLPYNIFNDLILKQIALNKKEKDEIKKMQLNKNKQQYKGRNF